MRDVDVDVGDVRDVRDVDVGIRVRSSRSKFCSICLLPSVHSKSTMYYKIEIQATDMIDPRDLEIFDRFS